VPAERIAESLAFINWTVLTALGVGSFAAVVAGRFRTDATRGYLAFTACSAAAFALLQGIDIVAQRFAWPEQTMRLVIVTMSRAVKATRLMIAFSR